MKLFLIQVFGCYGGQAYCLVNSESKEDAQRKAHEKYPIEFFEFVANGGFKNESSIIFTYGNPEILWADDEISFPIYESW